MLPEAQKYGVLTFATPNRVGISATVNQYLAVRGANIIQEEGDVLINVGVQIVAFSATAEKMKHIVAGCKTELRRFRAKVIPSGPPSRQSGLIYEMDILTQDAPGIGGEIKGAIALSLANIVKLKGERYVTPGTEQAIYHGYFRLSFPDLMAVQHMKKMIQQWEQKHRWEIVLNRGDAGNRVGPVMVIGATEMKPNGEETARRLRGYIDEE